ncbi:MAG: LysM peptidoglycan-binding domain-containing protein [Halanaerobiales bacterium]
MVRRSIILFAIILLIFGSFNTAAEVHKREEGHSDTDSHGHVFSNIARGEFKIVGFTNRTERAGELSSYQMSSIQSGQSLYIVQPGDSLYLIASKHKTSVWEIKKINNLNSDSLMVGQRLLLPVPAGQDNTDNVKIYTVQAGDSLYRIAVRNNVTVQEIKDLNNLQSDVIMVGQELLLPGQTDENGGGNDIPGDESDGAGGESDTPDTGEKPDQSANVYTVQAGDSLYWIAVRNNITVQEIKDLNNLQSNVIMVGQKLLLPGQTDENGGGNEGSDDRSNNPDTGDNEGQPDNNTGEDKSSDSDKNAVVVYFVRPGDSLWLISNKFNITVEDILDINQLKGNSLYVGQLLYLGRSDTDNRKFIYFVQTGDTLSSIASNFDISTEEIRKLNTLKDGVLTVDQKLYINIPDYSGINYDFVLNYIVEPGDNVKILSGKFGVSPWELRDYNNIRYNHIIPDRQLKIPFQVTDGSMKQSMQITEEEMELLSRAVYSEARGEPFEGQVAVAAVVLNRVRSSVFPDNIEEVIFQPWQFTAVHDGQFWLEPDQTSLLAAEAALRGWDPSGGALYYYNPETAEDDWVFYRDVIIEIGDHYFAISI